MHVKSTLSQNFTKKWSDHKHDVKYCNKTITIDGNWKTSRAKCCYDAVYFKSDEFDDIQLGCEQTPARSSYNCKKHADFELAFNVQQNIKHYKPNEIKLSRIGNLICEFYRLT